ncbi:hypothetical protein SAMN06296273_1361 [Nitrosomonas ureae]|uniref:Uncharacterized protein n=1 Tax=Nitrosomonas ureae TaxID=44577 RepID=A0A285BX99_9PROT|nr:hypothetical protein SAMN06296273_1361 [Nitrosomonas ureae]
MPQPYHFDAIAGLFLTDRVILSHFSTNEP